MVKVRSKIIFFFVTLFLFAFSPFHARAATLSISPSSGTFEVGSRVALKIFVTSNNLAFNAISGLVSFPSSIFSIESVSKAGSTLDFWVTEPTISKVDNTVKFEGVALGGAASGTVVTVNLRAAKVGSGQVSFKSGQILANDGEGTDITGSLLNANFSVKEASPKPAPPIIEPVPAPVVEPVPVVEIPQPAPTLKAPEIMLGTKYGAQAILGISVYPKAQALVTFIAQDGVKVFILGTADEQGEFNILVPRSLKRGVYTVTAVMIKEDKTNSDTSNAIIVNVGNIISDITIEAWVAMGLLLLMILYLLIRIYFHLRRDKNNVTYISKEKIHGAEDAVHKSFDFLRNDVNDRARGIVNEVERTNIEELKKDIDSTEKQIEKEIDSIEP